LWIYQVKSLGACRPYKEVPEKTWGNTASIGFADAIAAIPPKSSPHISRRDEPNHAGVRAAFTSMVMPVILGGLRHIVPGKQ
jgi:hypothetical protein